MPRTLRIAVALLPLLAGAGALAEEAPKDHPAQHIDDQASKPASLPDQNAKQEPSAKNKPDTHPSPVVFVDGALAVPGAAPDSQTRPAKFSAANDADDKIPIMARGPRLTGDQKQQIADALRQAPKSGSNVQAAPTYELPASVDLQDWPAAVVDAIPAVRGTKFVRLADRIVIVQPPNRIVIGEIAE